MFAIDPALPHHHQTVTSASFARSDHYPSRRAKLNFFDGSMSPCATGHSRGNRRCDGMMVLCSQRWRSRSMLTSARLDLARIRPARVAPRSSQTAITVPKRLLVTYDRPICLSQREFRRAWACHGNKARSSRCRLFHNQRVWRGPSGGRPDFWRGHAHPLL
jgi:hypothetical protein